WTTLGLLSCAQGALYLCQSGQHLTRGLFAARMLDWYTCAVFTPLFFWTATHYPVDRRHWRANLLVQLVASSIAVVIKYAFLVQVWRFMRGDANATLARALASNFIIESMIFWAVIAIIHGILFYRRWQEREQLAAELRVRLSEAQLEVLRGQLRPHFLFNTLNRIATLIHSAPASGAGPGLAASSLRRPTPARRSTFASAMTGVASSGWQTVASRLTRVSVWATPGCVSVNSTATRMRSRSVVGTMAAPSSRSRF